MGYPLPANENESGLITGIVRMRERNNLLVHTTVGTLHTRRAAGCLLVPEPGDTVLVALPDTGEAWVICVLNKQEETGELALPSAVHVRTDRFQMDTTETVFTGGTFTAEADALSLSGKQVSVRGHLLSLSGGVLLRCFSRVQTFARTLQENVLQRCGMYQTLHEKTADLAERQAGRMRVKSETSLRVRSETMDMKADIHLDLDAEHIKVG